MDFNEAFASIVFSGVEELLTVPWSQGLDQINTAFSSRWRVIQDGSIRSINANNTFSYVWTLFEPFYERTGTGNQTIPKLDLLCEYASRLLSRPLSPCIGAPPLWRVHSDLSSHSFDERNQELASPPPGSASTAIIEAAEADSQARELFRTLNRHRI